MHQHAMSPVQFGRCGACAITMGIGLGLGQGENIQLIKRKVGRKQAGNRQETGRKQAGNRRETGRKQAGNRQAPV